MSRKLVLALLALMVPAAVFACEGECIVQITNAYVGNYTTPVDRVMQWLTEQVSEMLPGTDIITTASYLAPILNTYDDVAYTGMETAIFPHYFHGKCARNGVDPPGCPNPDCPVVCGTPGSMVHFFPTLRFIAYNETRTRLEAAVAPGSDAYQQIEQNVLGAANTHWRRESLGRIMPRAPTKSKGKPGAKAKKYKSYKTVAAAAVVSSSSSAAASPSFAPAPEVAAEAVPDNHIFVPVFARDDLMTALSGANFEEISELSPIGAGQLNSGQLSPVGADQLGSTGAGSTGAGSTGADQLGSTGAGQLLPRKATATKTITAYASTTPTTDHLAAPAPDMPVSPDNHIFVPLLVRSDKDVKDKLQGILAQIGTMLGKACHDNGSGDSTNNLAACSWEGAMKDYILTFP